MRITFTTLSLLVAGAAGAADAPLTVSTWKKTQLTDQFWAEGANVGDFNKDGVKDVVYGPFWWAGPDFKQRHAYQPATRTFQLKLGPLTSVTVPGYPGALGKENQYSENFFAWTHDFNADGWDDILIGGFPGADFSWYENPKGGDKHWVRHKVYDVVDNESPGWMDVTGDGKPEIICNSRGFMGYITPDWSNPAATWTFHPISPKGSWQRFTHGLGIGDVNNDGRLDFLEMNGWWEQPASLAGDPVWTFHPVAFAPGSGSAQMFAYDVNGDGRNDVITSLAAHGYGLAWYEQLPDKNAKGEPQFKQNIIINSRPTDSPYGVKFSQLHAVDLVDMDGDGLKDIVTGKRFWAHGPTGDAEPNAAAVLYWFKLVRVPDGTVDWKPFQIDADSGIGTQVVARDINGDGRPDVVAGNKKGAFVHLQSARAVSREEWEKAQPKMTMPGRAEAR